MAKRFSDKSTHLRILLSVFGFGIALIAAEIASSYFHYPVSSALLHRIPDPVLGWRLEPNAKFTQETGEVLSHVAYNSRGWHDTLHDYAKPSGVFRIIILGDSFMEAYSVGLKNSFASQLSRLLKQRGKANVEVINLGTGGYGTLQEYYVLKNEGLKYHPDLVLLGFFIGGDLSDNSLELERRKEGIDSMKFHSRPFLLPGLEGEWNVTPADYQKAKASYERAVRELNDVRLLKKSHLYQFLNPLPFEWKPKWNPDSHLYFVGPHRCKEDESYQSAWIITRRIIARLKQDLSLAHTEVIVFTVPSLYETNPARFPKIRNRGDYCMQPPAGYNRLKAMLDQEQIPWIDLLPEFRRAEQNETLFLVDGHWNAKGHQLAALEVDQYLKMNNLLKRTSVFCSDARR